MANDTLVKRIQDIMRQDAGINGDAQRIEQLAWLLFLKIYAASEEDWEFNYGKSWQSIIPGKFRWKVWAQPEDKRDALTGEELLNFVNNELFPQLKNLPPSESGSMSQDIVRAAFEDNNNYMKDGVLLRQVINVINELDFEDNKSRDAFGEIYETILKSLQSAGNAGEFYTPRAVTDFVAKMLAPKLGERIADFACGTGGFLTSAVKLLKDSPQQIGDLELLNASIQGIEKKGLPYLLCATNMFLHGIDNPQIFHANALEKKVEDYTDADMFDIIMMNPPYGGSEQASIKANFPADMRSSETADLFMALILHRLKRNGRACVVIPDGFLFGNDSAKLAIKEMLLTQFNLHTVIRLPQSVFAPYTSITTNLLFFDNSVPTEKTWFYRLDMPEGYKNFSKTKPMLLKHFKPVQEWWENRREIEEEGFSKAKCYTLEELKKRNYNLDLCGYPHEEEEILPPMELIGQYQQRRAELNDAIDGILKEISALLQDSAGNESHQ